MMLYKQVQQPHLHKDESGLLVKCYHQSKSVLASFSFWLGLTIGFPLEHALWEHVWPFTLITKLLNL